MKKINILILLLLTCLNAYCLIDPIVKNDRINQKGSSELFFEKLIGKDFPVSELKTIRNETLSFDALKGKVVFINFWFKSCAPCMAEMRGLQKLHEKYNTKCSFLMISFEAKSTIKRIINQYGLKLRMISVDLHAISSWNITWGYPTSLLLGKDGKVIFGRSGGMIYEEQATKDVLDVFGPKIDSALIN